MKVKKVALGYWYQRTTLHLAEIHDFLLGVASPLDLDPHKLVKLRKDLGIRNIRTDIDVLERLDVEFEGDMKCRIYEDGLVLLTKDSRDINHDLQALSRFFQNTFLPAISYLFSLGAPVPKELAGVVAPLPVIIVVEDASKMEAAHLFMQFQSNFAEMNDKNVQVLKGGNHYLINVAKGFDKEDHLIESLIFFKEFKAQLHHYLNVHRSLWEKIERIKEKGYVRGKEVTALRSQLESYKKTVELIGGRIDQMNLYIPTRSSIVSQNEWEKFLTGVLEFEYSNLDHTLGYIKSLWGMTMKYLDSAIQIFSELAALSTRSSINALTIISSIGVISGIIGFLATDKLPEVTSKGLIDFGALLVGAVIVNRLLAFLYRHIKYKVNDVKLAKLSAGRKK